MRRLAYQDFDLLVDRDGDLYRARVLASPGGQSAAATRFALPFTALELENFLLKVGGRKRGLRGGAATQTASITEWGGRLFEAVFTGDVRGCLNRSLAAAESTGLRIRLHLSDSPELADLPWEYLYDPDRRRFLCLSEKTPLVRYLPLPDAVRPLRVDGPVRILAVIPDPDVDADRLDVEREWKNLHTALAEPIAQGAIQVDRLAKATMPELHRQLGRGEYHVLHFIGHGRFNTAYEQGELLFEDERGRAHAATGTTLATILHDHESMRIAVLNACEGARANAADPFAGTAQTLIQQGIPAVVAMQFEISDPAAIAFSEGFYDAIARRSPLDAAMATGRTRVFTTNAVEWATPVLYTRAADTAIFAGDAVVVGPAVAAVVGPVVGPVSVNEREAAPEVASPLRPPEVASPLRQGMLVQSARTLNVRPTRPTRTGRVVVWNHKGVLKSNVPTGLSNVVAVATGNTHRLVLHADGRVTSWGTYIAMSATAPPGLIDIVAIAADGTHSLFLHADGHVSAAGSHRFGRAIVPDGVHDVVAISAGVLHSLVLHSDGRVSAFGANSSGATDVPAGLEDVIAIGAGWNNNVAVHSDGRVTAWGDKFVGDVPERLEGVTSVSVGGMHALALHEDGHVSAWGDTKHGATNVPDGLHDVVAVAAGTHHSLALRRDGNVTAWGGSRTPITVPAGLSSVLAIDIAGGATNTMGGGASIALVADP